MGVVGIEVVVEMRFGVVISKYAREGRGLLIMVGWMSRLRNIKVPGGEAGVDSGNSGPYVLRSGKLDRWFW